MKNYTGINSTHGEFNARNTGMDQATISERNTN